MKITDVYNYTYVEETAALFQALALRHVMLQEGRLDEAGIWDTVKGTVGSIMRGIKSADDAVNKLGRLAQNTKPVEAFDSKVDEVVATIKDRLGAKAPKAVAAAERYAEWAKKNPIKQGLIIGALTAVAALASGPGAAAAAGFILRTANEYMKGEKASTAIGKGVKTGALGAGLSWLAGVSLDALKSGLTVTIPPAPPLPNIKDLRTPTLIWEYNGRIVFSLDKVVMPTDTYQQISSLVNKASKIVSDDPNQAASLLNQARKMVTDPNLASRVEEITKANAASREAASAAMTAWVESAGKITMFNNQISELIPMLKTAANGVIQGTAASGITGQAADAAKSAAGAAVDKAKGVVDKVKGFVPSKTYRVLNRQIKTLDISDQQKLVQYLQQKLATAS